MIIICKGFKEKVKINWVKVQNRETYYSASRFEFCSMSAKKVHNLSRTNQLTIEFRHIDEEVLYWTSSLYKFTMEFINSYHLQSKLISIRLFVLPFKEDKMLIKMNFIKVITVATTTLPLLYVLLFSNNSFATPNKVKQVDSLIQKWIAIEQQRNAMVNDWRHQEPLLKQRLMLLKQEQAQLEKNLAASSDNESEVEQKRAQLLESQNDMESEQVQLEEYLVKYFQVITEIHPQLPPPLFNAWHKKISSAEFTTADITKKLNTLLELLDQLNDFEQRISHAESALILPTPQGDKEIMVQQLYIGLAQAWYVSLDGRFVGRGIPEASGWRWQADDSVDGETVLNAIAMIERRSEAQFLQLPISLKTVAR